MSISNRSLLPSSCPKIITDNDQSSKHSNLISVNPPPLQLITANLRGNYMSLQRAHEKHAQQRSRILLAISTGGKTTDDTNIMMGRHTARLAQARLKFKQLDDELGLGGGKSMGILRMIDVLQRFGLDHHFEEDIEDVLKREESKNVMMKSSSVALDDLLETSLRFRLLRHQGYCSSSDVFRKFITKEGKFECDMGCSKSIMGIIELHEASYCATKGESILDEAAGEFSAKMLELYSTTHQNGPAEAVALANYTLRHPFHRGLPRFDLKSYLDISQSYHLQDNHLMDLARLDFNMDQSMHQQEVVQISMWWKELELTEELEYARNEPVKWYMWPLAMLTDPKLSEERLELAKPISFIYLIDDIFDVYGSLDELTLFTEIVNRWDIASASQLPDYMMKCFISLDEITNQIGYKVYQTHGLNPTHSLRQAWVKLFNAFLVEARWFKTGESPTTKDYLKNGTESSGVQVVLVHLFFLLGQGLTQRNVDLVNGHGPPVISSVAKILRLSDDLSAVGEERNGDDGSYLDCYLKENPESSIDGAKEHVIEMIEEAWKQLNHETLSPTPFPLAFNRAARNLAKLVSLMYGCDDDSVVDRRNQTVPTLNDRIKSMLFERLPYY